MGSDQASVAVYGVRLACVDLILQRCKEVHRLAVVEGCDHRIASSTLVSEVQQSCHSVVHGPAYPEDCFAENC